MHILVVEDEVRLADALGQILEEEKYQTDVVYDGRDGLDYALSGIYDLIILDVMLPKMNGFDVAANLRKDKVNTPILMLTAKDAVPDKVTGLDSGADDYMTKPFETAELLARVRALTRRQGEVVINELTFEDLRLDLSTCDLSCGDKSTHLNFKEFEILKLLMTNPKTAITKEDIIIKVWGYDTKAELGIVWVYISYLRKKLLLLGSKTEICAKRGVGYTLETKK